MYWKAMLCCCGDEFPSFVSIGLLVSFSQHTHVLTVAKSEAKWFLLS